MTVYPFNFFLVFVGMFAFCVLSYFYLFFFFLFLLFSFFVLVGLWKFFDSSLKEFGGKASFET